MRYPELAGRVAVVTGAGSNLGRVIAVELAREGIFTLICDVNGAAASQTEAIIRESGHEAIAVTMNVAIAAEVSRAFETAEKLWGRIDILVNSAGVTQAQRPYLADLGEDLFDRLVAVNL